MLPVQKDQLCAFERDGYSAVDSRCRATIRWGRGWGGSTHGPAGVVEKEVEQPGEPVRERAEVGSPHVQQEEREAAEKLAQRSVQLEPSLPNSRERRSGPHD